MTLGIFANGPDRFGSRARCGYLAGKLRNNEIDLFYIGAEFVEVDFERCHRRGLVVEILDQEFLRRK